MNLLFKHNHFVKLSCMYVYVFWLFQELHKSAEEAANAYEYDPNLVLKNVNYTNVNAMGRLMNLTEYSHHFKQNVYNETSGVQIPIEIYEGCKNICFFFLLVHILTFILFPYSW